MRDSDFFVIEPNFSILICKSAQIQKFANWSCNS